MSSMIKIERETAETSISLELELYGSGKAEIDTGIGFFDHMLNLISFHGFMDLKLTVQGDLEVDEHHTVEDVGIVLGQAIKKALGDKAGIKRYGNVTIPMDEVVMQVVLDLSGRSYYAADLEFSRECVGAFPVELFAEFFRSLSSNAGMNLHFMMIRGGNAHHVIEGAFKAFGRALDEATSIDQRIGNKALSTKGSLGEGDQ
ncbi:imidazoleglycerol-phosphate dehydratase HisB [Iocasia frigidifontis]|uniref:Imidazoleglycerol-phosphate dehydratase n=1 Tax=Iocasia fonsfrigidae TaxID=2682810 RepID=A0A8A7KB39_9FIRM|nr:imidazoleglycerol-phosphate dehydratase HisB [Iocasia fonsfrigidae]